MEDHGQRSSATSKMTLVRKVHRSQYDDDEKNYIRNRMEVRERVEDSGLGFPGDLRRRRGPAKEQYIEQYHEEKQRHGCQQRAARFARDTEEAGEGDGMSWRKRLELAEFPRGIQPIRGQAAGGIPQGLHRSLWHFRHGNRCTHAVAPAPMTAQGRFLSI